MKILLVMAMVCMMAGCATLRLDDNATPEQVAAAKQVDCQAAAALVKQSAVELANLKAAGVVDGDAVQYWTLAQTGATLAMLGAGCTPVAQ